MQHHTEKLIQAKKQEELRVAELIKKLEDDTQVAEQSNKICSRPREKLPSLDQINAKIHKLQTRLELQQVSPTIPWGELFFSSFPFMCCSLGFATGGPAECR